MSRIINKIKYKGKIYELRDRSVPSWSRATHKPSYTPEELGAVPSSRTINGKKLSSNISLTASNVGAVPTSRKINNKSLSGNITLTAEDVGALPNTTIIPIIQYIANEASMPPTPEEGVLYLIGEEPEIPEEPEDTPDLITFTIDGIEYQAEEGMTWEQWINSEYCTIPDSNFYSIYINYDFVTIVDTAGAPCLIIDPSISIPSNVPNPYPESVPENVVFYPMVITPNNNYEVYYQKM